ncbi:MAG TPA: septal ring lytic transglycosylase RlpA family protein [Desulfuromonadales bacterium]|jgi:rare lipoprotein A
MRRPHIFLILILFMLAACSRPAYRSRVIDTPETKGLKGWEKPYEVNGERYEPMRQSEAERVRFVEEGIASWYGRDFHGKYTSNGEIYDMYGMTAAHKTLPLGVSVKVINQANGREAVVRVNDRGPFIRGRIIDLSYSAANALGVVGPGTAPVRIEALGYQEKDSTGLVAYRQPKSYTVDSYSVQVGAFTLQDNARRLSAQLQSRYGYAGIQEGWVGGKLFYRVRAGRYPNMEAAEAAKLSFEANGYPNSFVVATE